MPISGIRPFATDVIQSHPLAQFDLGSASVTIPLDSKVSGSVQGDGLTQGELDRGPRLGNTITIDGRECRYNSRTVTWTPYYIDGELFPLFSISASFEETDKSLERHLKHTNYDFPASGSSVPFWLRESESATFTRTDEGYNDAELTLGDEEQSAQEPADPRAPKTLFQIKPRSRVTLTEGDTNPTVPPVNTKVLRDTSSNFDQSGPKKVVKTSTRVNGQIVSERTKVYGFAYLWEQTYDDSKGEIYSTEPEQFWQLIEDTETTYIYNKADGISLNVTIVDPSSQGIRGAEVGFAVHPDYAQFAQVELGGSNITFKSNAEYLVGSITRGWKLARFKQEDDDRNTLDPEDPYYPFFKFMRLPVYAQTAYTLKSSRGLFGEEIEPPYRIEFVEYETLEPRIKRLFSRTSDLTEDGRVALIYPEPNYVEPLFISEEATIVNSFAWVYDPEGEAENIPGLPGRRRPKFTTGEESYYRTYRKLVSADRYTEYTVQYSAQDPNFESQAEQYSFREMSGRPSEPQHMIQEYEATEQKLMTIQTSTPTSVRRYLVTTENARRIEKGGSVSVNATNVVDARREISKALIQSQLQANSGSIELFNLMLSLSPGRSINLQVPQPGRTIITSVSHNFQMLGRNTSVGWLVTGKTSIQTGSYESPGVRITHRDDPIPGGGGTPSDPTSEVELVDGVATFGRPIPVLPNRRNF